MVFTINKKKHIEKRLKKKEKNPANFNVNLKKKTLPT